MGGSGKGVDLIVYGTLIMVIALARPEGLVGLFRTAAGNRRDEPDPGDAQRHPTLRRPSSPTAMSRSLSSGARSSG